jgi:hypothetical protein
VSTTKVSPRCDVDQHNSDLGSSLSDVRKGADRRRNWISRAAANLFLSHHLLGLRTVWREICSLPSRIAIAQRNNWFRYGNSLDYSVQGLPIPYHARRKWRCVRIRGIQIMRSIHPRATPVDFHILLTAIDPLILQGCSDMELGLNESLSADGAPKCSDKSEMEKRKGKPLC